MLSACSELGREAPLCEGIFTNSPQSVIISVQAVPWAEYGPCLDALPVGWDYEDVDAERGRATFWIDSDRMGRFLEVILLPECEPRGNRAIRNIRGQFSGLADEVTAMSPVGITLVPVFEDQSDYAVDVGLLMSGESIAGHDVQLTLTSAAIPARDRIEAARAAGDFVFVLDAGDAAGATIELRYPGVGGIGLNLSVDEAIDEIEDRLGPARYQATWYFEFERGCILYEFDAAGPGVETVQADVIEAIGFYSIDDLTRLAARAGFRVRE